jgi:hypothetical protein
MSRGAAVAQDEMRWDLLADRHDLVDADTAL